MPETVRTKRNSRVFNSAFFAGEKIGKRDKLYIGCLVYRILTHGQAWVDRGTKHFEEKNRQREINELQRKATALGLQLLPATSNA